MDNKEPTFQNSRFLRGLELRNFRAFESEKISLAPITILVGPNNAGKSSILSAIRLLAQTLKSADSAVPLLLGGLGTYKDIVHGNNSRRIVGLAVTFADHARRSTIDVNFRYRAQRREIILRDFLLTDNATSSILLRTKYSTATGRQMIDEMGGIDKESARKLPSKIRFHHFLPRTMPLRIEMSRLEEEREGGKGLRELPSRRVLEQIDRISRSSGWIFNSTQFLGPFREQPLRMYPFSGERPTGLGETGGGATDILVADFYTRGTRKQELTKQVRNWLGRAGIAADLIVHPIGDRHYEIRVQHPRTGEIENLADVGYGISQILPVIIGGYNLSPDGILVIEQPELHLHPAAQAELGEFFFDLYRARIQCIIETHSEHLIMRLQRRVAEGLIPPSDIAIRYVSSSGDQKRVEDFPLDEHGLFTKDWPGGFFEERLKEAKDMARARFSKSNARD